MVGTATGRDLAVRGDELGSKLALRGETAGLGIDCTTLVVVVEAEAVITSGASAGLMGEVGFVDELESVELVLEVDPSLGIESARPEGLLFPFSEFDGICKLRLGVLLRECAIMSSSAVVQVLSKDSLEAR